MIGAWGAGPRDPGLSPLAWADGVKRAGGGWAWGGPRGAAGLSPLARASGVDMVSSSRLHMITTVVGGSVEEMRLCPPLGGGADRIGRLGAFPPMFQQV